MSTIKPEEGTEIPEKCADCPDLENKNKPGVTKNIIEGTEIRECPNAKAVYSQLSYESILNFIYKNCAYGDGTLKNTIDKYIIAEDEAMGTEPPKTRNLIEYSRSKDTKNHWFNLDVEQTKVLDTFLVDLEKSNNEIECTPIPKIKSYKTEITGKINDYITPALDVVCPKADYIKETDCKKYLEEYDKLKLIDGDGEGQEHALETIQKNIEETCKCTIFFPTIIKWEEFTIQKNCKGSKKQIAIDNIIGFGNEEDAKNYIQYWASENATSITMWDKNTGNNYLPPLYIHQLEIKNFLIGKNLLDLTTEQALKDMRYFSITEDLIVNEINNVADLLCAQVFSVIKDSSRPIGTVIRNQILLCTKNSTIPGITKKSTRTYCPAMEVDPEVPVVGTLTQVNLQEKSLLQTNDESIDNGERQRKIKVFYTPPGRIIHSNTKLYRETLDELMNANIFHSVDNPIPKPLLEPKNVSRSINEVITASITEAMRPYIYQAIEELNKNMKEFGEFIISGGDAINNLLQPNLRQVTPDVDTKFILKYSKFENCGCTPEDKTQEEGEKLNESWCNSDIHYKAKDDFEGCQSLRQNIKRQRTFKMTGTPSKRSSAKRKSFDDDDVLAKTTGPLKHLEGDEAKKLESNYFLALLTAKHKLWYDALEKLLEKWNDKDFYQRLYYNILMPLEGLVPMSLYNVKFIHPDLRRKRGTHLEPIFKKRYTFMPKKPYSTDSPPFLFDVELFAIDMMIDSLYDIRWDEVDGEPRYKPQFEQLFRGNEPRIAGIIDLPFTKPTHLGYNLGNQEYYKEIKLNPYEDGEFTRQDTLLPQQTSLNCINARNAFVVNESVRASYDDLFYYAPQPSPCITIKVANEKYIKEDVNLLARLGLRAGTKLEKDLKRLELLETMKKMDSTAEEKAAARAAIDQADKNYMTDPSIDALSTSMNSLSLTTQELDQTIENDPTYQQSIPASAEITPSPTPTPPPPSIDDEGSGDDVINGDDGLPTTPEEWITMFTQVIGELSTPIYQSESQQPPSSPSEQDDISISTTKISFGTVNIIGINLGKIINILAIPKCIEKCCTDPVECPSPNETTQTEGFIPLSPPTQSLSGTSIKLDVNLTNERFKYSATDTKTKDAWQDCCDIVPNQFIFRFNSKSLSNWNHKQQDSKSTMTDDSLHESQKTFKLVKYIMKEFKNYTKEISNSVNDLDLLFNLLQPMSYGCKNFFYDSIKTNPDLLQKVCKLMISNILIVAISLLNVQDNVDTAICKPDDVKPSDMTDTEWKKLPKVVKTLATGIVNDLKKTYNEL